MWEIKNLKRSAREAFRRNFWRVVIVCFLLSLLAGAYNYITPIEIVSESVNVRFDVPRNTDIVDALIQGVTDEYNRAPATRGLLAGVFNSVTKSGSFIFGIVNAVNQFVFENRIFSGVLISVGAALSFLYWIFVGNLLRVGSYRFFLENRIFTQTPVNRMLYIYKSRRIRHVAWIMFLRSFYMVLWSFTIVGGVIKYYSWRMVPYILAENPDVTKREAFMLSTEMMRGHKWRSFLLDISFLGWWMLSLPTFGILDILYVNPYKTATNVELYMELRTRLKDARLVYHEKLCDRYLLDTVSDAINGVYPLDKLPVPESPRRRWLAIDYHREYSFTSIVLLFFSFALIGWVWEVGVDLFNHGQFMNRGTLLGPWVPLYGVGGLIVIVLLRRWIDKPITTFFLTMLLAGVVEYFTGWLLETLYGMRWWEYDDYLLNINGRVCLEGLIVFGLAGCFGLYFLAPILDNVFQKIPHKVRVALCTALLVVFFSDVFWSFFHPNTGDFITPAPDSSQVDATATAMALL